MGRPKYCHDITRETETNIITMINTLNVIILSRRPIFFGIVILRVLFGLIQMLPFEMGQFLSFSINIQLAKFFCV